MLHFPNGKLGPTEGRRHRHNQTGSTSLQNNDSALHLQDTFISKLPSAIQSNMFNENFE
ncbi:hypothetical protein DPMN_136696 [Dreissena polymorpha]|uniref:Uncharacterized protein n=1 Tax=Dreissena polymorpha TaxID=45954 RepID=A0A9D4G0I6_DREPO|nr:hypothetical protein DPMN_136696 [Dreissena polymorpha]